MEFADQIVPIQEFGIDNSYWRAPFGGSFCFHRERVVTMDRGRDQPSKFVSYFELRDAFNGEGCPVCRLLLKWTRRSLDSLFHEYVNDPGVRQRLRASQGFCNWHAWMATTIDNSPSGIAIIYEHLLKDQIEVLQGLMGLVGPRSWWTRLKAKWPWGQDRSPISGQRHQKAACTACERIDLFFEQNLIDTLVGHMAEPEFADGFRRSSGLCLPHLYQAVARRQDHPNISLVLELQLQKLAALGVQLREYLRKLDYRFMAEPRGDEQRAWRRVIELFVGKREVFGPDRQRREGTAGRSPAPTATVEADVPDSEPTRSIGNDTEHPHGERVSEQAVIRDGR
jgi:hypothetical protein